jgi:hypothetical protein
MFRRDFLTHAAAGGVCLFTFTVAGCDRKLTPAQARQSSIPFRTFDAVEVKTIDALGETLLPGSAAAGLAHYLDHQLSGSPADSMLMIKYLRVEGAFTEFYRAGLRALDAASRAMNGGKSFADLATQQTSALVKQLASGQLDPWHGPPASLFYFVLRADAVDVTYGTQAGFEQLGVPYMAHIAPPTRWGE